MSRVLETCPAGLLAVQGCRQSRVVVGRVTIFVCACVERQSKLVPLRCLSTECLSLGCIFRAHTDLAARTLAWPCHVLHIQVLYGRWPWKLIGGHLLPDAERTAMHREFFNEPPCCLDDWVSKWIRHSISEPSELDSEPFRNLFSTLSRLAPTTNMSLEGMLGMIRQSVGYTKCKPLAERLSFLGLLSQLRAGMPRHGESTVRESRDAMLAEGVPLVAGARAAGHGHERLDVAWKNRQLSQWERAHPGCSDTDRQSERSRIAATWTAMSAAQRAAAVERDLRSSDAIGEALLPIPDDHEQGSTMARWGMQAGADWGVRNSDPSGPTRA